MLPTLFARYTRHDVIPAQATLTPGLLPATVLPRLAPILATHQPQLQHQPHVFPRQLLQAAPGCNAITSTPPPSNHTDSPRPQSSPLRAECPVGVPNRPAAAATETARPVSRAPVVLSSVLPSSSPSVPLSVVLSFAPPPAPHTIPYPPGHLSCRFHPR